MSVAIIYHNPRCGKSRQTLALLNEHNIDTNIVEYLKVPLDDLQLTELIKMLGIDPIALVRKGEKVFKEEYKGKELTDEQWVAAMVKHPILIERPIVVHKGKAIVGRPPENVLQII